MEKLSYQDVSKQINYDVAEAFQVKLSEAEARKK